MSDGRGRARHGLDRLADDRRARRHHNGASGARRQERGAPWGVIQGFDVATGAKRWAWDMVNPQWTGDPPTVQSYARGTPNMWTITSSDEALGLVYLPRGNSAVDYWSGSRTPQEHAYSTSLVAPDVTTGRPRWHFRTVHRDVWDYDLGAQASLIDFPSGRGTVPALTLPTKQGAYEANGKQYVAIVLAGTISWKSRLVTR